MSVENRFDGIAEFAETARVGSFTTAAKVLGVTASAVGKSVSRLEARLGTKLLHRSTRSLTLTNEGEAYLASCLSILEELESAESTMAVGRQVPVGRVRIDLPGAFGRKHVLPTLLVLTRTYPRLDLSIMFSERTVDILSEGTDLAVRIGELRDDTGLSARRLGAQRLVVCASPGYLDRYGAPENPAELLQRDCIVGMRSDRRPTWLLKSPDGTTVSHEVKGRHEFSDGQAMVDAVLAGGGLSQLPTWLIGEHLKVGRLIQVMAEFAGAEMPIHAIWPTSLYLKPKVRVLIDALVETSKNDDSGFRTL